MTLNIWDDGISTQELQELRTMTVMPAQQQPRPGSVYSPLTSLSNASCAVYLARAALGPPTEAPRPLLALGSMRAHRLPTSQTPKLPSRDPDSIVGPTPDRGRSPDWL